MGERTVLVEHHEVAPAPATAAVLRLNRPDQLNPIDGEVLAELDAAITEVANDSAVRVVLVTGAGRAFSAGGDLKKYIELQRDPVQFPRFVADLHRIFGRFRRLSVPVVALVNGVTAAGGLELILNCDFAIVGASARIGDGHLNFGQMGGGGVLTLLPRMIGRARAAELVFSGRFLSAPEAVEWGLASRCVPDDDLLAAGLGFAAEVAAKSPLAVAQAKQVMNELWADNASVDAGLRYELERDAYYCLTSHDAPEGLAAFAERRPPRYEGR
jgi:enoyl-CoA hydratase